MELLAGDRLSESLEDELESIYGHKIMCGRIYS
jgi:hypothetical protein